MIKVVVLYSVRTIFKYVSKIRNSGWLVCTVEIVQFVPCNRFMNAFDALCSSFCLATGTQSFFFIAFLTFFGNTFTHALYRALCLKYAKLKDVIRVILCEKCHIKMLPIINRYIATSILMYLDAVLSCEIAANHGNC